MRYNEKRGHWPLMKNSHGQRKGSELGDISSSEEDGTTYPEKEGTQQTVTAKVRSIEV